MSKIWFTSDTHFSHQRTLDLSKRPYNSVSEMNMDMVIKWNSLVGRDDTVYHLGDFGNYGFRKVLNGRIILLLGNYERKDIEDSIVTIEELENKYLFETVVDSKSLKQLIADKKYELVHEPTNAITDVFKLFGHIHKLQMVKRNGLNVGVDCHNFYPISLETVEFYRDAIENYYDEDVFG